jgi:hypothetical protein
MDRFQHAKQEWERLALNELYREYTSALRQRKMTLVPAAIEIFDSETLWGQWDPVTRTIRLARRLIKAHDWFKVVGILLHELAHQLVDEELPMHGAQKGDSAYGAQKGDSMHGEAFRKACLRLGVPAEFSKASADLQSHSLDWREQKRDEAAEKMLDKVQKLLALAESSNENEALLAMNRVRELYAKHNLEQLSKEQHANIIHIVITTGSKRIPTPDQQIVGILVGHFFVQILSGALYDAPSGEHHRVLEIIGTRENAMMAEYVFYFLKQQVEHLVKAAGKERGKKFGRLEKKSYRMGILRGFAAKLKEAEQPGRESVRKTSTVVSQTEVSKNEIVGQALVAFEKDSGLDEYVSQIYPRIRRGSGRSVAIDPNAYSAGHVAGKSISLNKPVSSTGGVGKLLGI